jgi:hypothetical protein
MHDDDERALLDRLLQESRLYTKSADYFDLLQFIARLPNFAPFNAMLLHIQKPGIQYAASRHDWKVRFGAEIRENARPLIIMWPFGPVALIYDAVDVEGERIPIDARSFNAKGAITRDSVLKFYDRLAGRKSMWWRLMSATPQRAAFRQSNGRRMKMTKGFIEWRSTPATRRPLPLSPSLTNWRISTLGIWGEREAPYQGQDTHPLRAGSLRPSPWPTSSPHVTEWNHARKLTSPTRARQRERGRPRRVFADQSCRAG